VFSGRLRRDAVEILTVVLNFGTESFLGEPANLGQAARTEFRAAYDAEAETLRRFLHDLELSQTGHEHGEILGERNPGNHSTARENNVIGDAAFDALQQGHSPAASAAAIGQHGQIADFVTD